MLILNCIILSRSWPIIYTASSFKATTAVRQKYDAKKTNDSIGIEQYSANICDIQNILSGKSMCKEYMFTLAFTICHGYNTQ